MPSLAAARAANAAFSPSYFPVAVFVCESQFCEMAIVASSPIDFVEERLAPLNGVGGICCSAKPTFEVSGLEESSVHCSF